MSFFCLHKCRMSSSQYSGPPARSIGLFLRPPTSPLASRTSSVAVEIHFLRRRYYKTDWHLLDHVITAQCSTPWASSSREYRLLLVLHFINSPARWVLLQLSRAHGGRRGGVHHLPHSLLSYSLYYKTLSWYRLCPRSKNPPSLG